MFPYLSTIVDPQRQMREHRRRPTKTDEDALGILSNSQVNIKNVPLSRFRHALTGDESRPSER